MASDPLFVLVILSMAVVAIVLLTGIGGFGRGGEFNKKYAGFENSSENLINYNLLTEEEITWLNDYHNKVFKNISSKLDRQNKNWLRKVCTPYLKR